MSQHTKVFVLVLLCILIAVCKPKNISMPTRPQDIALDTKQTGEDTNFRPKEVRYSVGPDYTSEVNSGKPQVASLSSFTPNDNYIKNAANSNGKLYLWKERPIKVYIAPSAYFETIKLAFLEYNRIFSNILSFSFVEQKPNSGITVEVVNSLDKINSTEMYTAGVTSPYYNPDDNSINQAFIKLLATKPHSNEPVSTQQMYAVTMHEIGHAIGIFGHSQNSNDLMYAFSSTNKGSFTTRDIKTLSIMYSNNAELKNQALNGVSQDKLNEALSYAKAAKESPTAWINLANIYYDAGRKEEALEAYKTALKLDKTNPAIYQGMAQCYYASKKYDTAIKYYNYALSQNVDNETQLIIKQMIGVCYSNDKKYKEAYSYFKEVYQAQPDNRNHLNNLISVCANLDLKEEAKQAVNSYLRYHPNEANDKNFKLILSLR